MLPDSLARWTAIAAAGGAGLAYLYLAQTIELILQPLPDPDRQVFAGGVVQAFNGIQIVMIELLEEWGKCLLDVGKVHDPTALSARLSGYIHGYFE